MFKVLICLKWWSLKMIHLEKHIFANSIQYTKWTQYIIIKKLNNCMSIHKYKNGLYTNIYIYKIFKSMSNMQGLPKYLNQSFELIHWIWQFNSTGLVKWIKLSIIFIIFTETWTNHVKITIILIFNFGQQNLI